MQEFDLEELALFNGKEDKPVYIAHQGKVYDVSGSKLWKGGLHMRRHHAGTDLSVDIGAAPHGPEVLERYPLVGVIRKSVTEKAMPDFLSDLLHRYPFLRRHPHPMTVHFPIVFMLSVTVFNLLYLMTGVKSLETTALNCLGAGILFMPIVILTGIFSWWLNYMAKPLSAINVKLSASIIMFLVSLTLFTWRMAVPDILDSFRLESIFYFLLVLSLAPLVSTIGWYGAKLTFPIEKD